MTDKKEFAQKLLDQLNYVYTHIINKIINEYGILNSYIIFKALTKIIETSDWFKNTSMQEKLAMDNLVNDIVSKTPTIEINKTEDKDEYGP